MREDIINRFNWNDRENEDTFCPCDYCKAIDRFPVCNDGATSSACNHCDYNIVLYCSTHNTN